MTKTTRKSTNESLDHPQFGGADLDHVMRDLNKVNKLLFNYYFVTKTVLRLVKNQPSNKLTIIDLGCGGGGHLLHLAKTFGKNKISVKLIGIDHNTQVLEWAKKHTQDFSEISFLQADATSDEFTIPPCDILISSHFLYHFDNQTLLDRLQKWLPEVKNSILISSLQRSKLGGFLFKIITKLLGFHPISRADGQSALGASFTKTELKSLLEPTFADRLKIKHRPFFRIISTIRHAH